MVLLQQNVLRLDIAMDDMVLVTVNVTQRTEKLASDAQRETYLIGNSLNMVDIHSCKVVVTENVVEVVVKLLKHETSMSIVHKRVQ